VTSLIRSFKPRTYDTAKDAAAALIEAAGGLVPATEFTRVGRSTLHEYTDPAKENVHMPVDVALALERATGCHAMTELFARRAGAVLLRLPTELRASAVADDLMKFGKESGDVFAKGAQVLRDGAIKGRERPEFLREIDQAIAALASLRVAVETMADSST
jgi:hypothetical protein